MLSIFKKVDCRNSKCQDLFGLNFTFCHRKIIQKDENPFGKSVYLNYFRKHTSDLLKIPAILFKTWKQNPKHDILTKGAETLCG